MIHSQHLAPPSLLTRLNARDRELLLKWVAIDASASVQLCWRVVTHLGGAVFTIMASVTAVLSSDNALHAAGEHAVLALTVTHLVAQVLKRTITRPRPHDVPALIPTPGCFSFPSGHSIAASAVAFAFAAHFPLVAPATIGLAILVAASRVKLGVHYPGDVIAGLAIGFGGSAAIAALV